MLINNVAQIAKDYPNNRNRRRKACSLEENLLKAEV